MNSGWDDPEWDEMTLPDLFSSFMKKFPGEYRRFNKPGATAPKNEAAPLLWGPLSSILDKLEEKSTELVTTGGPFTKSKKKRSYRNSCFRLEATLGTRAWTRVPWISLLDTRVGIKSTQEGLYIVYLFCADMNSVFLCLHYGTTKLIRGGTTSRRKREKAFRQFSNKMKPKFRSKEIFEIGFNDEIIDLTGNDQRPPRGVQLDWVFPILSKEYHLNNMPSEEEMINDFDSIHRLLTNKRAEHRLGS